jgi:hypothetical protein
MNDSVRSINAPCADRLREAADLLEAQRANPFRVSAYRKAAATVLGLPEDVAAIATRDGLPGLEALPNIGRGIAAALGADTPIAPIAEQAALFHLDAALPHIAGDYMGEHWLASFALLALE